MKKMNQLLAIRLKEIRNNPEIAPIYAGVVKGEMFKPCKKCLGRGILTYSLPLRRTLCECVAKNVLIEIEESLMGEPVRERDDG